MKDKARINWKIGEVAIIKKRWYQAGKRLEVLGSAVYVEQWWVPVIDPDEADPTFFKEASLDREEKPEEYIPTSLRENMDEKDLPRTKLMFAIGQIQNRLALQCRETDVTKNKLWMGPTPFEINMLNIVGKDEFSVIIRYDLDGVDRIGWCWKEDRWEKVS